MVTGRSNIYVYRLSDSAKWYLVNNVCACYKRNRRIPAAIDQKNVIINDLLPGSGYCSRAMKMIVVCGNPDCLGMRAVFRLVVIYNIFQVGDAAQKVQEYGKIKALVCNQKADEAVDLS